MAEVNCQAKTQDDLECLLLEMDTRCYQYELESSEEDRKHTEEEEEEKSSACQQGWGRLKLEWIDGVSAAVELSPCAVCEYQRCQFLLLIDR